MTEQTEKSYQRQLGVQLGYKVTKKTKRVPGKAGLRFHKNVGLGFKTPKEAIEDMFNQSYGLWFEASKDDAGIYVDKKCPFTSNVSIRGRILSGLVKSAKMDRTIIVRRNYAHFVKKYSRYEKRHRNIPAHVSPCFRVSEGDTVVIGQCRPLSKTVRFNVLRVIPAGTSTVKKGFSGF